MRTHVKKSFNFFFQNFVYTLLMIIPELTLTTNPRIKNHSSIAKIAKEVNLKASLRVSQELYLAFV